MCIAQLREVFFALDHIEALLQDEGSTPLGEELGGKCNGLFEFFIRPNFMILVIEGKLSAEVYFL